MMRIILDVYETLQRRFALEDDIIYEAMESGMDDCKRASPTGRYTLQQLLDASSEHLKRYI